MRGIILSLVFAVAVTCGIWAQSPAPGQNTALAGGLQTAQLTLTAAQVDGMFTTPILFIPAQGAGTVISINRCLFNAIFGSAAFTGGGTINAFYGSVSPPVNLVGPGIVASFLTTFAANQITAPNTAMAVTTAAVNAAVYISNQTGVFASGTGSSLIVNCQYSVAPGMQ